MVRYRYVGPVMMVDLDVAATINGRAIEQGLTVNLTPGVVVAFDGGHCLPRLLRKGYFKEIIEAKTSVRTDQPQKNKDKSGGNK